MKRLPPLQEFERDPVRRLDERHMAVARRAVDGDARCLKPRAGHIDVVHDEGEMAEIASSLANVLGFAVRTGPVVGEFEKWRLVGASRGARATMK